MAILIRSVIFAPFSPSVLVITLVFLFITSLSLSPITLQEWVESLNSVLDDNRLLTMPSGERIQFGPNVNFLFETHNLVCASPATVSRMGMIFLSEEDLDVKVSCEWLRLCIHASLYPIGGRLYVVTNMYRGTGIV